MLDRALDALIRQLEKRKFAATAMPRTRPRRATAGGRYIPAHVKRAVAARDQGRCTFVSEAGRRCSATYRLEFDHVEPVARGGRATVDGIRLRCRAHNQYEAERMFGAEFMRHKREQARRTATGAKTAAEAMGATKAAPEAKAEAEAQAAARACAHAAAPDQTQERDVIPWLRKLGFSAAEARRAAAFCESIPDAPIEERVRVALSFLCSRARYYGPATNSLGTAA